MNCSQIKSKSYAPEKASFSKPEEDYHLLQLPEDGFKLSLHWHISDIHELWDEISPDDLFFSSRYLSLLELYPMDDYKFCYGIVYENEEAIGIIYFQLRHLELKKALKIHTHKEDVWSKIFTGVKSGLAKNLNFSTLICGNVLLTGEYGIFFQKNRLSYKDEFRLVEDSISLLHQALKKENLSFGLVLMKDFYLDKGFENQEIKNSGFAEFSVQPNMILQLKPEWTSFEDYLAAIKSKYRVRTKRAFKKATPINKRKLSFSEIQNFQDDIFRLYKETSEVADFNLFSLKENYFTKLAEAFPECFELYGYFLDEQLVGFFSYFINGGVLDAHFLGYNPTYNPTYQLYLNMLFDLIHAGIQNRCDQIKFSRTALEIKSSVGAEPKEMFCYLKHRQKLPNVVVPSLLKLMVPDEIWLPRNPFK
jgi:hypothetical protein